MQPKNIATVREIDTRNRQMDPIETAVGGHDDAELAGLAKRDIDRIDTIFDNDPTLTQAEQHELYKEGCDLRLDLLYAGSGGGSLELSEFNSQLEDSKKFFDRALDQSKQLPADRPGQRESYPQSFWDIDLKQLDLRSLQAYRNAHEAQTTLRGTPAGQNAWNFATNQLKGVLADSVKLMSHMSGLAEGDSQLAQDARGKLYETMLLTYARIKTYEDETYDEVFVRSALSREDRPWNNHATPRRAFDMIVQAGRKKTLLQAKNYRNYTAYAQPIRKVTDEHFGQTLDHIQRYISSFKLVIANPSDPHLKVPLTKAADRLDQAFGKEIADTLVAN